MCLRERKLLHQASIDSSVEIYLRVMNSETHSPREMKKWIWDDMNVKNQLESTPCQKPFLRLWWKQPWQSIFVGRVRKCIPKVIQTHKKI